MSVYTRKGDSGHTSLASGRRVPKYDNRVEAYGCIDELQAAMGLARSLCVDKEVSKLLLELEGKLMPIMGELSMGVVIKNSAVVPADIESLEAAIDEYGGSLPPLTSFAIPGSTDCDAALHLARTVCRRAERRLWMLAEADSVSETLLAWVNRLSDLLFVLARFAATPAPAPDQNE